MLYLWISLLQSCVPHAYAIQMCVAIHHELTDFISNALLLTTQKETAGIYIAVIVESVTTLQGYYHALVDSTSEILNF